MIDKIVEIMEKHQRTFEFNTTQFPAVGQWDYETVAKEIAELFRSRIHFTKAELRDLERLTAGTSEDWCQKLNHKFEKALGIKEVKCQQK